MGNASSDSEFSEREELLELSIREPVDDLDEDPYVAFDDPDCKFSEEAVRVDGSFLVRIAVVDIGEVGAENKNLQRAIQCKRTSHSHGSRKKNRNRVKKNRYGVLGTDTAKKLRFEDGLNDAIVITQRFDSDTRLEGNPEIVADVINVSRPLFQDNVGIYASVDDLPDGIENITNFNDTIRDKRLNRKRPVIRDNFPNNTYVAEIYTILANSLAAVWSRSHDIPVIHHGVDFDEIDPRLIHSGSNIPHKLSYKTLHNLKARRLFPGLTDGYSPVTSPLKDVADAINLTQIRYALDGKEPPFDHFEIEEIAEWLKQ